MVPELVGKLTGLGYEVAVEPGAGNHALIADEEYAEAGARSLDEAALDGADAGGVGAAARPRRPRAGCRPGTATISFLPTQLEPRPGRRPARRRRDVVRDGAGAADLAGAVDGRAVLAGAGRRLPLRDRRRRDAAPLLPAQHDRRRHGPARRRWSSSAPASPGCRRSPPPSGSAPSSRPTTSARPPPRRSGRWAPRRSTSSWRRSRASGGYAREMTEDRAARQRELLAPYIAHADALITTAAVPGPAGAAAGDPRDGRADGARLGRRRPGRRDRRQRRGLRARRGRPDRQRPGVGRPQRADARCPGRRRGSTPRTSSTWSR